MVPASEDGISTRARSTRKCTKLTILYRARKVGGKVESVNCLSLGPRKMLTASAGVQFTVRTKLDTVDRTMVTLQNLTLLTIDRVYADPFICQTTGNEAIL